MIQQIKTRPKLTNVPILIYSITHLTNITHINHFMAVLLNVHLWLTWTPFQLGRFENVLQHLKQKNPLSVKSWNQHYHHFCQFANSIKSFQFVAYQKRFKYFFTKKAAALISIPLLNVLDFKQNKESKLEKCLYINWFKGTWNDP